MSTQNIPEPSATPPLLQKKKRALSGWIILAFAITAGFAAAVLAIHTLDAQETALKKRLLSELTPKKESTVSVVVPIENLPAGTVLTLAKVARRFIPADNAPAGAVLDTDFDKIALKRLLFQAEKGKPITLSMINATESPADVLDDQHVALTISVNSENSLDKMLRPGDRIDLLWITSSNISHNAALNSLQTISSTSEGSLVRFLGQNLKIIATGRELSPNNIDNSSQGYNTITLEVTPLQAQEILVAQKSGEIRMDLRGNEKNSTWPKRSVSLHDIIGYPPIPPAGVEYIAGGTTSNGPADITKISTSGQKNDGTIESNPSFEEHHDQEHSVSPAEQKIQYLPFSYIPPLPQS